MRTHVLGPSDAKKLTSALPLEETIGSGGMPGLTMDQRLMELGTRIESAVTEASKKPRSIVHLDYPWLHEMAPDRMVMELEQRLHLSERVVTGMMRELVDQAAVSEELRAMLRIARERLVEGGPTVPGGLISFVRKMHDAGLLVASVKDMSRSSLEAVVALLNGDVDQEVTELVGIARSSRRITAEDAERALEEADRMLAEHRQGSVDDQVEHLPMVIEPVVPEGFDSVWDYANGPLPPEYWSTVQTFPIPYAWEYRMAVGDEEDRVLGMALPEAHSWSALCEWDRQFKELAFNPIRNKRGASNNIRDLMAAKLDIDPDDVDTNLVRTWLLLLAARLMTVEECDRIFDPDFFEGVVMPCPATGAGVVRQLVRQGD
jgi:hypothetical protein